jgi:hypothetical protein
MIIMCNLYNKTENMVKNCNLCVGFENNKISFFYKYGIRI